MTDVTSSSPSRHRAIASRVIGSIVQAGPPKVSPDGQLVAFTVARVDEVRNKTFSQVWIAATDGSSTPRPLTAGDHDGEPAWAPDGRSLAFISRRSEQSGNVRTSSDTLPAEASAMLVTEAGYAPEQIAKGRKRSAEALS